MAPTEEKPILSAGLAARASSGTPDQSERRLAAAEARAGGGAPTQGMAKLGGQAAAATRTSAALASTDDPQGQEFDGGLPTGW